MQRKYIPLKNDFVIGVIKKKSSSGYFLDINSPRLAYLSSLSFTGASKRHKPNYDIGDAVFCRVEDDCNYTESELTCVSETSKKEWSTKEAFFGKLENGYLFNVSQNLSERLLTPSGDFGLEIMGELIPFEITIGVNGKVWVNAESHRKIVVITNIIRSLENIIDPLRTQETIKVLINRI